MFVDLHCHSRHSHDSLMDPEFVSRRAPNVGFNGVCVTDQQAVNGCSMTHRIAAPFGFVVLRGVEVNTWEGRVLAYGVEDDSRDRWGRSRFFNSEELVECAHSIGALCVPPLCVSDTVAE